MRYFCITYYRQPDGKFNESTAILKNLKTKDYQTHDVILDFKTQQIIKCHVNDTVIEKNWNTVIDYYEKFYREIFRELQNLNQNT